MVLQKLFLSILLLLFTSASQGSLISKVDYQLSSRTDVLLIYKNRRLIYQEYANGYKPTQKHRLWSISKSVTGLLLAQAVHEQRIQLQDSICDYLGSSLLLSGSFCSMTVDDLLFWQSGTQWEEIYLGLDGTSSPVLMGLYGPGINHFAHFYFSLEHSLEPHENHWNYSTGDTNIISYLLQRVYSEEEYKRLPWTRLFDGLGVHATFERDHTGLFMGGSYVFMSGEDLYKVGQFALDEAKQPNHLPSFWMKHVLTAKPKSVFNQEMVDDQIAPAIPGGHWWLNQPTSPEKQMVPWPDLPRDSFAAFGVFGQQMYIIPSEEIIIIRLAQDIKGGFDRLNFLKHAYGYAKEVQ